jgi:hypothetical protein
MQSHNVNSPGGNGATVGSSTFGGIISANRMRQLQLGVKLLF